MGGESRSDMEFGESGRKVLSQQWERLIWRVMRTKSMSEVTDNDSTLRKAADGDS